jgi:hypothetical protein
MESKGTQTTKSHTVTCTYAGGKKATYAVHNGKLYLPHKLMSFWQRVICFSSCPNLILGKHSYTMARDFLDLKIDPDVTEANLQKLAKKLGATL